MAIVVFAEQKGPVDELLAKYDQVQAAATGRTPPKGMIAHFCVAREDGIQVIGVWESSEDEQKAHAAPDILDLREKFGLPRHPVVGPAYRVHNMKIRPD